MPMILQVAMMVQGQTSENYRDDSIQSIGILAWIIYSAFSYSWLLLFLIIVVNTVFRFTSGSANIGAGNREILKYEKLPQIDDSKIELMKNSRRNFV
jgi:hypothetical protein